MNLTLANFFNPFVKPFLGTCIKEAQQTTKTMKTTIKITLQALILALGVLFFTACDDENNSSIDTSEEDIEIFSDATSANSYADEDLELAELVTESDNTSGGRSASPHLPECATVIKDQENHQIVINFGESCIGPFGRERSGKIIISYGGEFNDHTANRTFSFDNYKVNNRSISGMIYLRDFNRNEAGLLTATRSLEDYTVTFPNGNSVVLNGSMLREWIVGEGDGDLTTNAFRLTGSYEGISTRGITYTHTITEPVIARFSCRAQGGFLRTAGIVEMVRSNENRNQQRVREIRYGDDTCDNAFTVVINGREFTITED